MIECHGVSPLELAIWSRVSFNKIAKYPHCLSGMIFIHVQLLKPQAKYMHIRRKLLYDSLRYYIKQNSTYRFLVTERFAVNRLSILVHTYHNGSPLQTEEERFRSCRDFRTMFTLISYASFFHSYKLKRISTFINRNISKDF